MIDQIKRLCNPVFQPGTLRADVSGFIEGARIDLATLPPSLIFDSVTGVTVRDATEAELAVILAGLQANPPHPEELTASEALARFTPEEQDAAFAASPRLAYRLFTATEPFAWQLFADSVGQLVAAGVPINSTRILGPQ